MDLRRLIAALDDLLDGDSIDDYGPNGLQVEGRPSVERIVTAVSASRALFLRAIDHEADLILVHHGLLWNQSEAAPIVGSLRDRLSLLLENRISLAAYHLPLDRHLRLGNAAQLASRLGLQNLEPFGSHRGVAVGVCGVFPQAVPLEELIEAVTAACEREPLLFEGSRRLVSSVGIVTGAAEREFHQAVSADLDAYITGEATEWVMHQAAEDGVHYIAAGHYATERFGVRALGEWIREHFDLEVEFIDLPNPV
ncbi:MAG: Nif3-like dinuclear metal center hexameric protein [bacterium]|nr:Nif3-like dinuclear metal center hexameric protein [bacterium]